MSLQVGGYTVEPGVLTSVLVFLTSLLILRVFRSTLLNHLEKLTSKTKTDFDDLLIMLLKDIPMSFYMLASVFLALQFVTIPVFLNAALRYAIIIVAVYYAIRSAQILIDYFRDKIIEGRTREDKKEDPSFIKLLAKIVKLSLWVVGLLLFFGMGKCRCQEKTTKPDYHYC